MNQLRRAYVSEHLTRLQYETACKQLEALVAASDFGALCDLLAAGEREDGFGWHPDAKGKKSKTDLVRLQ